MRIVRLTDRVPPKKRVKKNGSGNSSLFEGSHQNVEAKVAVAHRSEDSSGESSRDEDTFEKQIRLVNESDKTLVRPSTSQAQVDQLEGCLLKKPIPCISNYDFSQKGIFYYWNDQMSGNSHVKRTCPDVVRMWRQFHG